MFPCLKPRSVHGSDLQIESWSSSGKKEKMKRKSSKNPFADRGLDKFAVLSQQLQEKKQDIISKIGGNQAEEDFMVRFAYSERRHGWVPLVTRFNKKEIRMEGISQNQKEEKSKKVTVVEDGPKTAVDDRRELPESPRKVTENQKGNDDSTKKESAGLATLKAAQPVAWLSSKAAVWLTLMMALVLFCLVLFGKTLAILCTASCWYFIDFMNDTTSETHEKDPSKGLGKKIIKMPEDGTKKINGGRTLRSATV